MHQGWALKKQKIPSSSPRSLLVISSALFFVLAPGIIVRRRIKGKKRIQKQQVLKNKNKKTTSTKPKNVTKISKSVTFEFEKQKKMQTAHKHKMSRRTNWKYLKKMYQSVTMQLLQLKVIAAKKSKINVQLKKNINQKKYIKNFTKVWFLHKKWNWFHYVLLPWRSNGFSHYLQWLQVLFILMRLY